MRLDGEGAGERISRILPTHPHLHLRMQGPDSFESITTSSNGRNDLGESKVLATSHNGRAADYFALPRLGMEIPRSSITCD